MSKKHRNQAALNCALEFDYWTPEGVFTFRIGGGEFRLRLFWPINNPDKLPLTPDTLPPNIMRLWDEFRKNNSVAITLDRGITTLVQNRAEFLKRT